MLLTGYSSNKWQFFPFLRLEFGAHLQMFKMNMLKSYYLTVYFNTEVYGLIHAV